MDPELESSLENEAARQAAAREAARRGFSAYRQVLDAPDEVPYMIAAPEQPPVSTQPAPQTASEVVRSLEISQVPRRPQPAPQAPAGPQAATGAPVPTGVVNLGPQPVEQAPAAPAQGVGIIPPEIYTNPNAGVANQILGESYAALQGRGVYTGPPTRTRSVQTFNIPGPVSAEASEALSASDEAYKAALRARSEATARGLGQQGEIFEQADLQSQLEAQRQQQAAEDQARTMQWQTERADNINQQVLSGRIDPNRVLGDSFSGGRIAAALGLFISGLAQGEQGANSFLQIINQTIDRDIAAQMANMDNLRAGAQNQQNLVGMYRTVFGDETAAREAARATMLQSVAQKLQAQQARMGQAGQGPALQLALAELERAKAAADVAAQQAQGATVSTRTQDIRTGGVVGGPNYRLSNALRQLGTDINATGVANQQAVRQTAETVGQLQQRANPPADPELVIRYGDKRTANLGAEQAIRRIRNIIARNREDVPGAGMIDRLRPNFLQSFDGRLMASELGNLKALYLKGTTGAVANQMEQENAENLTRGVTEEDLFDRIDRMEQLVMEQRRVQDASFPPEVVRTFQARMGPPPPQPLPVQGRQQR